MGRYCLCLLLSLLGLGALAHAAVTVESPNTALVFDPADGYAVSALIHRGAGFNFVAPRPGSAPRTEGKPQERSPWRLSLRLPSGSMAMLTSANARSADHQQTARGLTVTWQGVGSVACPADLAVTMTVGLDASGKSAWNLAVAGTASGALWQVDFPRVAGLRPVGEDALLTPLYLGRLQRNPTKYPVKALLSYPSPASMQFLATYGTSDQRETATAADSESGWSRDRSDALGVYLAAEDGRGWYKGLGYDTAEVPGQMRLWVQNVPTLPQWPLAAGTQTIKYELPYDVVLTAFTGDAHTAARMYRDWAQKQTWCARGTADNWPTSTPAPGSKELTQYTPTWFRNTGFWAKFYHEPAKVVPEWAAYEKWLRVPIASHYYRGTISVFDDNYPEMLPTDPHYLSGIRDAKNMGIYPLPYTNGVVWDRDTQSWLNQNGQSAAIKDESGQMLTWDISSEFFQYMCPGAKLWRDRVGETAFRQVAEHGLSGVYLDCLAASAAYPCYDAAHGHTLRGGDWYAQGQHQLMVDLRAKTRAVNPTASYFPEECGEWLIDVMDGFLTLDLSRGYPRPGEQIFPLFDLVYHPYTINFGDDVTLEYQPDRFAWEMGSTLVWGMVPLHSPAVAKVPQPRDPNSEMFRDLVQAYYVAGLPFLQGGEAVPMTVAPLAGPISAATAIRLATAPHNFDYQPRPTVTRRWEGPAVLASAWRRRGDVAVVMVNITAQDQPVKLSLDPERLGLNAAAMLLRTWPREAKVIGPAAGEHALIVPARRVMIVVLTADVPRASVGNKLLDTPWELLTVESGEFKPLEGPGGMLWACSDGLVANHASADRSEARPMSRDEKGELQPRQGVRTKLPEGMALPRKNADKPFLLLRPLPCLATWNGTVLSGDDRHLSAWGEATGEITFDEPGLGLVRTVDGKVLHPLGQMQTVRLRAPDKLCWIGYARLDTTGLPVLLQTADRQSQADLKALTAACNTLLGRPSAAALAAASRAMNALELGLQELPAALVPDTPLLKLHAQLQALVAAQLGGRTELAAEDDWLAPGLPKTVAVLLPGTAQLAKTAPQITPIGGWNVALMTVVPDPKGATLTLNDPAYVERIVPVVASVPVRQDGLIFVSSDILQLDSERPMELQTQALALTAIAGGSAEASAVLRNWSPYDLPVTVRAQGPEGWQVATPAAPVAVPAGSNQTVKLLVHLPAAAPRARQQVQVTTSYAPNGSVMTGSIDVNVQPRLLPLLAESAQWAMPTASELTCVRQSGTMAICATANRPLAITISNHRVTQYTNAVEYKLLDPELKVVKSGKVPLEKSEALKIDNPLAGAYLLQVIPQQGSATVETDARPAAEFATQADPMKVFCSPITRYFFVPANAKVFRLGAVDGGPDEGAKFVITSPAGRVAFSMDGDYNGREFEIPVPPPEAGKVWQLRLEPRQDITFWLTGDVCPYLSTAPERVVVEAGAQR